MRSDIVISLSRLCRAISQLMNSVDHNWMGKTMQYVRAHVKIPLFSQVSERDSQAPVHNIYFYFCR